jgi:hypothetical protein
VLLQFCDYACLVLHQPQDIAIHFLFRDDRPNFSIVVAVQDFGAGQSQVAVADLSEGNEPIDQQNRLAPF